jgi:ABC-type sugar transport system ATPase subunit
VAQLVGSPKINLVEANCEDGTLCLARGDNRVCLADVCGSATALPSKFILGVRPEDVRLQSDGVFGGEVVLTEPLGVETLVHIKAGEQTLVCTVPGLTGTKRGDAVRFNVTRERLHFFDWARGTRLTT